MRGAAMTNQQMNDKHSESQELKLNPDGSLVELEPGSWFVGIVPPIEKEWWNRFAHKDHTHVFALRPVGDGQWLIVESWWTRVQIAVVNPAAARKFLRWGAEGDVFLVQEDVPGRSTQWRIWVNCANLVAHVLGRSYWVWTPHQLYRRLTKEPDACHINASALLEKDLSEIGSGESRVVEHCEHCRPGTAQPGRRGTAKPFCMKCGRDLEQS